MPVEYKREVLSENIGLTVIRDSKFKSNMVSVNFMTPLSKEKAAVNVVIPSVLISTNKNYPDRTVLTKKMASLYGATLGSGVSQLGDVQFFSVRTNCIRNEYALEGEKLIEEVTEILLDCIFEPFVENGGFAEKEFAIKKQELVDYIDSMINEKRAYAIKRSYETVFENEPFAINAFGTKETALELDAVKAYEEYKELLKTAGIEIYIVGGGELDVAEKLVKERFSKLERNNPQKLDFVNYSPVKAQIAKLSEAMDINQCKMVMAYKSDYEDIYVAKFMTAMLGGTAFSKLFTNVREKLSLCYYCAARYVEGKGALVIDSGVDTANIELAQKAINEQLEDIARGDFSDELLENTRLHIIGDIRSSFDTLGGVQSWYFIQRIRGTDYSPEKLMEIEKSITREQIIECAKTFKPDTYYVLESSKGGNS